MAQYKLCISDPKTGRTKQLEVKDNDAKPFVGMKLKQQIKGESCGLPGYEFLISGGSDKAGFPMRSGIMGKRKIILAYGGTGIRTKEWGIKQRKTVCGSTINADIVQINLKILKAGTQKLFEDKKEEAKPDGNKAAAKEGAAAAPAKAV
ncbi:30S ribosomal protein S6e [Candidatus Woesearchaeota archaeon]|nr:30S ribosomal protein S6e [Candidatus Woesearchaeota archaeon]